MAVVTSLLEQKAISYCCVLSAVIVGHQRSFHHLLFPHDVLIVCVCFFFPTGFFLRNYFSSGGMEQNNLALCSQIGSITLGLTGTY